ncbi:RDD family protein [Rugosimonospora acidiphila]
MAERSAKSTSYPSPSGGSGPARAIGEPANLGRRFIALMIDWILCLLVSRLFVGSVSEGWAPLVVLIVEYTFFIGLFAQTPGMKLTGVRCVSVFTGGAPGIPRTLLRALLLSIVIPCLIMDDQRRGLHDRAAGTIVTGTPATGGPTAG